LSSNCWLVVCRRHWKIFCTRQHGVCAMHFSITTHCNNQCVAQVPHWIPRHRSAAVKAFAPTSHALQTDFIHHVWEWSASEKGPSLLWLLWRTLSVAEGTRNQLPMTDQLCETWLKVLTGSFWQSVVTLLSCWNNSSKFLGNKLIKCNLLFYYFFLMWQL